MKRIFGMYGGLRKEIYIICFGRLVTSMGGLVWPMLTLILKSKLGFNAEEVALWFLLFGVFQIPFNYIGGRLTDRYNKRNLILIFDFISVVLYCTTAVLPLTTGSLWIYFIGSLFQHMEWPAYDALIAEMTSDHDREKAYSLQYLAANLGVVFAPTLGGLLFQNYLWLSFLICGMAVFSSTVLIFFFIPKNVEAAVNHNTYENREEGSLFKILKGRSILIFYTLICCISITLYNQFNYLLPIQMDEIFLEQGAVFFGMLTSVNGLVVISCTPILTQWTLRWCDLDRIIWGVLLQIAALCSYYFYYDGIGFYIVSMVIFTIGEVLNTLGAHPYLSKRVPASHRGRIISIHNICTSTVSSFGNTIVGRIIVLYTFREGWIFVFVVGSLLMSLFVLYRGMDRKRFELLYHRIIN
ncbi:MAG: MFS transporter [Lachnospiraceae bacterium]|nr:MFS transporter [Lachnospiraceae bacterium]